MSEKRFTLEQWTKHSLYYSDGEYSAHMSIGFICEKVEKKLNEQQAIIQSLKKENEQLQKEVKNRSAFIIDKGLGDTFVRWKNER